MPVTPGPGRVVTGTYQVNIVRQCIRTWSVVQGDVTNVEFQYWTPHVIVTPSVTGNENRKWTGQEPSKFVVYQFSQSLELSTLTAVLTTSATVKDYHWQMMTGINTSLVQLR